MKRLGAGLLTGKKKYALSNRPGSVLAWSFLFLSLAVAFFIVMLNDKAVYFLLVKESAYTELLTAILYLVSGVIFFLKGYQEYKVHRSVVSILFYLLFGLLFVFIAGEEESWGQWIFYYEVPESISKVNVQNELNIHNMAFFSQYSHIFNTHRLLIVLSGTLFFILPVLAACVASLRLLLDKMRFPVAPMICAPLFVIVVIYEKLAMAVFPHWSHAEIAEFFYSIGFFLYAVSVYTNANEGREPASAVALD